MSLWRRIGRRWRSLGFFWQTYVAMVFAFGGIVTMVEAILEPALLGPLATLVPADPVWHEAAMWFAVVLLPTVALGWIVAKIVTKKLAKTMAMADRLARGDLSARIPVEEDDNDVFARLGRAFNTMADSLQASLEHEKRLLADVSHELRSPLTRIGVAAALLPMRNGPEQIAATAGKIEEEVESMNALVAKLLQQGRDRLAHARREPVDLSALADGRAAAFLPQAETAGIALHRRISPGIQVLGDAARIVTMLDNLLANALFYTQDGGCVTVVAAHNGSRAILTVFDTGPGVPESSLDDIFRPFFRIDESRDRASGGVGLGLALVRDAAVAMGGDATASNLHPGLAVRIDIPTIHPGGDP